MKRVFFCVLLASLAPKYPALAVVASRAGIPSVTVATALSGPRPFNLPADLEWSLPIAIDLKASTTAVYDISAHVVVMPDGSRLEAHSGLGIRVDDPRFVRERMRGPTPPGLYALAFRERLFHGVRALRLFPILGNVFGRSGLLAHTYMLRGGRAESNGCVVFRDYPLFLKAFREGRIRGLLVVPTGVDNPRIPIRPYIGGWSPSANAIT